MLVCVFCSTIACTVCRLAYLLLLIQYSSDCNIHAQIQANSKHQGNIRTFYIALDFASGDISDPLLVLV